MTGKNKKRNAFSCFVYEWKQQMEQAGETFANGMADAFKDSRCHEKYKNLSEEEKEKYKSMARGELNAPTPISRKQVNTNDAIRKLKEAERKRKKFDEEMKEYIHSVVVMGVQDENLHKENFILVHTNWFCAPYKTGQDNELDYFPAEIAVATYTLENGIGKLYHEIVSAKIPTGYTLEAHETSKRYHQIPVEFSEGQDDFSIIYKDLVNFLIPNVKEKKFPPLFASQLVMDPVRCLLNRLSKSVGKESNIFKVYCLEDLFTVLHNAIALNKCCLPMHKSIADEIFRRDVFQYETGLGCQYHKSLDGVEQYCSESIVKRWGFTISSYCCDLLEIDMIPGVHYPTTLKTKPTLCFRNIV